MRSEVQILGRKPAVLTGLLYWSSVPPGRCHSSTLVRPWLLPGVPSSSLFLDREVPNPHVINHHHHYSMVQSPSWEANWSAASQEIPRISRNPKVHYRTHKRPPLVSILSQPNPVHIPTSHLLEIHPNIIHPSTPRSPQWSPPLQFPHQEST